MLHNKEEIMRELPQTFITEIILPTVHRLSACKSTVLVFIVYISPFLSCAVNLPVRFSTYISISYNPVQYNVITVTEVICNPDGSDAV